MHYRTPIFFILALVAPTIWAHGQGIHTHGVGLLAGLAHPFSGLDHLLAMLAVGMWAAQQGGRALWALPLTFVGVMALGSALGVAGIALPGVEAGILLSVLVLGLLVALASRWALPLAVSLVGLFALFHGAAHGLEMPLAASPWAYGAGMLAATAVLHVSGVLAGIKLQAAYLRVAGAAVSLVGMALLLPMAS